MTVSRVQAQKDIPGSASKTRLHILPVVLIVNTIPHARPSDFLSCKGCLKAVVNTENMNENTSSIRNQAMSGASCSLQMLPPTRPKGAGKQECRKRTLEAGGDWLVVEENAFLPISTPPSFSHTPFSSALARSKLARLATRQSKRQFTTPQAANSILLDHPIEAILLNSITSFAQIFCRNFWHFIYI